MCEFEHHANNNPQPTLAAVAGGCLGGVAQLAASCNLLLSHRQFATFCLPGSTVGGYCHTPSVTSCTRVGPHGVGPHGALELGLLGETISAEEAVRIGLDNRSVPADAWRSTVDDMALRLASGFNRIP